MSRFPSSVRLPIRALALAIALLLVVSAAVVASNAIRLPKIITPKTADQVTNIDVLRSDIKNYYGTPGAASGSGAMAGWTLPLNMDSNYAKEAESVAANGTHWINAQAAGHKNTSKKAIVLDVDDTTLTTWNYELYSNWDYNPGTNEVFVGLTTIDPGPPAVKVFTGNMFPATPGMVDMVTRAHQLGYAVFFITGRGDSQHLATIANLVNDVAAYGGSDVTTTGFGNLVPEIDAGYPMPTAVDTGHGSAYNGGTDFADGLFTKPSVGDYPGYLNQPQFCGQAITDGKSCATVPYKAGTRAYIENVLGYDIIASFGDQWSDHEGGYTDQIFKMPNPNYYLP